MSIIWDLKKLDLSSNPTKKKIIRNLHLKKSNSFNFNSQTKDKDIRYKQLLTSISFSKRKKDEKLKYKNIKLKINLNNIDNELILAKSAKNKKAFQIEKNCKLISNSLNIKKLNLFTEQNSVLSSSYAYNKKRENEIIMKTFKSNLVQKIKKKYSELENKYKNKTKILSDLKNIKKNNNNKELQTKNKKILENFIKLKNQYDSDLFKNNEYKIKIKEYIELEEKLTKKNFCILELKESLNDINYSNINLENDIENLKNKLEKLERENEKLNSQYNILSDRYTKVSNDKREIEKEYAIFFDENNKNDKNINLSNFE